jgi:hypothetical protein
MINADGQISFIPWNFVGDGLFVNDLKFTARSVGRAKITTRSKRST